MIATEECIGVKSSKKFLFYILALPTGAYFKEAGIGAKPVDVLVSESVVRAFPGGTGNVKSGANYAVTLEITKVAFERGCSQVLFLNASNRNAVEEMGGMNVFFVRGQELLTPPLSGTILPGVVRQSILELAGSLGLSATETPVLMDEVRRDISRGLITEAFACGTAACVAAIAHFHFENGDLIKVGDGGVGPTATRIYDFLQGMYRGTVPDGFGWTRNVCKLEATVPVQG